MPPRERNLQFLLRSSVSLQCQHARRVNCQLEESEIEGADALLDVDASGLSPKIEEEATLTPETSSAPRDRGVQKHRSRSMHPVGKGDAWANSPQQIRDGVESIPGG